MKKKRYTKELEWLENIILVVNKRKRKLVEELNKNKRMTDDCKGIKSNEICLRSWK
jgi:hypothetical protein